MISQVDYTTNSIRSVLDKKRPKPYEKANKQIETIQAFTPQ